MAAAINLCETKQELLRIAKKYSHCDKVVYYELLSDGVCPTCSLEIFKLEKKYQIAERLKKEGFGDRLKPLPAMTTDEYRLWRVWRNDRDRFRKVGVWGGDVRGEIGQGPWSLKGWDPLKGWHPTRPGRRSLRSEGGGFEWAFHWDPFLGSLSDVRYPEDDRVKYGLEKLLGEGGLSIQYDEKESGNEAQAHESDNRDREGSSNGERQRGEGQASEVIKYVYKKLDIEEGQKQEVRRIVFKTST